MRKILTSATVAAVLVVLLASTQGTAALWRAKGEMTPGTINTGTLSLQTGETGQSGGAGAFAGNYVFTALDTSNMGPGAFTQAPLTIRNAGSVALSYTLAGAASATPAPGAADAALAAAVELSIFSGMDPATCAARGPLTGTQLFKGSLSGAATFAQSRTLAEPGHGASQETLCVRVTLPAAAPPTAAGGSLALLLSWRGDQV